MRRFLSAVSLVLLALGASASNVTDEINNVLKQIAEHNVSLKSLKHNSEADVLETKSANVIAGPSVEYSPFFKSGYSGIAESELIVKEDFEFPTKYSARNRLAELQKRSGELSYEKQRRDILLEAKLLCLDVIKLNQTLHFLRQRLENCETLNKMFQKRLDAGDANILDVNKGKLDYMEVRTLISETENERSVALQQLQMLNGGIAVDITAEEFPEVADMENVDEVIANMMAKDAGILQAEAVVKSQEQEVEISRKEWLPNLSIGYRRNTEMNENVNGILLGVSFPVFGNSSKVKAAKHRKESAELQLQELRQSIETQLRSRYQELKNLQRILDHSDVEMMQEMIRLLSKALQYGEITALQYYAETNSIYEKIQRHIDVHCQMVKLNTQLHLTQEQLD